ncbi:MAG: DUF3418 domain-containing protein, partial [Propionibacteriaceae bacterium]|nr:DUF3418 domain-containing protein [Propionibacteriaceae bacterium]
MSAATEVNLAVNPDLPIAAYQAQIAAAILANQVVVVAGETGSGKTTQLPKICLSLGRNRIGHTQPRRIAARSLSARIAQEIGSPLGEIVGYQVRFTDATSRQTQLKVMTDGILLAEIGHDRNLTRYDTIIIDEAHERSLNIDFLLGYLKQLLPKRPDLKVIITSATIDTARFAAHFDAPIVEVAGRSYPVEVRYLPPAVDDDPIQAIVGAIRTLPRQGDILVFCSGEREIKDAAKAIAGARLPVEILPLFARLSMEEQARVFAAHSGQRVVLATNVAETSLTVPGVRYVVDPGLARISRYSARTKVQRLPIEPISQASANQRAGRCGRVAAGICLRLYSEADFLARDEFTEPEILRTNLASVILAMANARLGDIADFPFVEPPDRTHITDGLRLLAQLGAIEPDTPSDKPRHGDGPAVPPSQQGFRHETRRSASPDTPSDKPGHGDGPGVSPSQQGFQRETRGSTGSDTPFDKLEHRNRPLVPGLERRNRPPVPGVRLTGVGRQLASIPVDPQLGRILLEGAKRGCLRETQILVAALSIPDVRERPQDHREQADAMHARFGSEAILESPTPIPLSSPPIESGPARITAHTGWKTGTPAPQVDPGGDFAAWLRLWTYLRRQRKALSANQFRKLCRNEFLNWLRVGEWSDLVSQLREISRGLKLPINAEPAPIDDVITACLAGLLSNIGSLDQDSGRDSKGRRRGPREYLGTRGARFAISPGSLLAKATPDLVVAVELVETTRLWAHTLAAITAEQVEAVGSHLLTHTYAEPFFSTSTGAVLTYEKVSLLGVPLIAERRVGYAKINPTDARRIFIQSGLVEGLVVPRPGHAYARVRDHNQALRDSIEELEHKARRRGFVADDQGVFEFFDSRLPPTITSLAALERWLDRDPKHRARLMMTVDDLFGEENLDEAAYPDTWSFGEFDLGLDYHFAPGDTRDGVTVEVPLATLTALDPAPFTWGVPGSREELAIQALRSLPKTVRTRFVPIPDWARQALTWLDANGDQTKPFLDELARALRALTGDEVSGWDPTKLPDHLRIGFQVQVGSKVEFSRDLGALQAKLTQQVDQKLAQASRRAPTAGTTWLFGTLPPTVQVKAAGLTVEAYPALRDDTTQVSETLLSALDQAQQSHAKGLSRLVAFALPEPHKWIVSHLSMAEKLALGTSPYPSVP